MDECLRRAVLGDGPAPSRSARDGLYWVFTGFYWALLGSPRFY